MAPHGKFHGTGLKRKRFIRQRPGRIILSVFREKSARLLMPRRMNDRAAGPLLSDFTCCTPIPPAVSPIQSLHSKTGIAIQTAGSPTPPAMPPHSAAVPSKLTPPVALPPPKNSACCGKYDRTEQHDIAVCPRRQRSMRHEGKETARKTDQAQARHFFSAIHPSSPPACLLCLPACFILLYHIIYAIRPRILFVHPQGGFHINILSTLNQHINNLGYASSNLIDFQIS